MNKVFYQTPLIVARKGIRGFHYSSVVDSLTTIVDNRVKKRYSLVDALILLTGYQGVTPEPVCLNCEEKYVSKPDTKINTPDICCIFKYAIGKWQNDMFTGIVVDNSNNRYQATCSANGNIQKLILIETFEIKQQKNEVTISDTTEVVPDAKVIDINRNVPKELPQRAMGY